MNVRPFIEKGRLRLNCLQQGLNTPTVYIMLKTRYLHVHTHTILVGISTPPPRLGNKINCGPGKNRGTRDKG